MAPIGGIDTLKVAGGRTVTARAQSQLKDAVNSCYRWSGPGWSTKTGSDFAPPQLSKLQRRSKMVVKIYPQFCMYSLK